MEKPALRPEATTSSRKIAIPRLWKVETVRPEVNSFESSSVTRCFISRAALLVNVTANIELGSTFNLSNNQAIL